ncbi:putative phage abortive infection protein [Roseivirga echinicomitans]|uniref:Phage abortive infection protein n=1 Tax=Roseivirga echinicomitans TaxID=296218 RepID=A0A150XEP1_9BACT|nr:putative phage abortive infection protein [Roseivirga echinicomitans]KYG77168.1 hypothetical protein AWN68_18215 [Roseivirga echinicomitans]
MSDKTHFNPSKVYFIILAFGGLLLVAYICLLTLNFNQADATTSGAIGDAFGGVAAPFVGTAGVLLTFLAFWVQYIANERQREAYEQQRNDIKRERFENKFYELLRLHKENVNEVNINHGAFKGRDAFILMYREYKFIYLIVEEEVTQHLKTYQLGDFELKQMSHRFAFDFFMNGVGPSTDEYYEAMGKPGPVNVLYIKINNKLKELTRPHKDDKAYRAGHFEVKFGYKPVNGHISRLSHYYRHLYHTIRFVVNEEQTFLQNYDFIRLFRSQLSIHEVALLYYNSFWYKGQKMWKDEMSDGKINHYIIDYKLLKNLPETVQSFGLKASEKLRKEMKIQKNWSDKKIDHEVKLSFEQTEDNVAIFEQK